MELIKEFKKRDIVEDESQESDDEVFLFIKWISEQRNATVKFIGELMMTYAFAIYLFKTGVRANNVKMIDAARTKFANLFYAFNHPYYREVEYRDLKNRLAYRDEIKSYRDKHMSYSKNSLKNKSEGGDFILEGKVQRQKLIAPKGPI